MTKKQSDHNYHGFTKGFETLGKVMVLEILSRQKYGGKILSTAIHTVTLHSA